MTLTMTQQEREAYVSVEGSVVSTTPSDDERDQRPMARRYLGVEHGDRYVEETRTDPGSADNVVIRMRPERWLTADYSKEA